MSNRCMEPQAHPGRCGCQPESRASQDCCRELGQERDYLRHQVAILRQHKTDYMEAAEGTRKALEAECERLRACRDMEIAAGDSWKKQCQEAEDERDALRAENERLREERDSHQRDSVRARLELAALKAVPDAVEVVAWRIGFPNGSGYKVYEQRQPWAHEEYGPISYEIQDLMTVAQHNAIVAAMRQPVADERELADLKAKHGEALEVLSEILEEAEGLPTEIEWKALRVVKGRRVYADNRAALSAPAAGQDVSALVEALEASNLLLRTKRHACESTEVCHVLDTHIKRNSAALAAHKAGEVKP